MATTAFDVVLKELEDRIEMVSKAVSDGCANDFAEYKSLTGEIRGLSLAQNIVKDLLRKLERDEDE